MSSSFTFTARLLTPQGEIKEYVNPELVATVGLAVFTDLIPPTEGFLLSVHLSGNGTSRGQCFARVFLRKNIGGTDITLGHLLCQGYVSADDHLGYPQSPTESSLNGAGWVHSAGLIAVGVGIDFQLVVPTGVLWKVKSVTAVLTTSAAVGNRTPILQVRYAATGKAMAASVVAAIPANTAVQLAWANGQTASAIGNIQTMGFPADAQVISGAFIETLTAGLDAADQWSNVRVWVEEYVSQ